jgi:TolB-like protein
LLFLSISPSFIYRIGHFEIDPAKFELRERGLPKPVEPQVLSLLILLVSSADRMISKDELVEKVWGGRFISDSAIATRIKEARRELGDDGRQQRFIRTVHGRGFRFCAHVTIGRVTGPVVASLPGGSAPVAEERPSIAVMPFRLLGERSPLSFLADALPEELISDLSRLRSLMVIARASSFRFRGDEVSARDLGAVLGVRYCLSGTLEAAADRVTLSLELAHTPDDAVIWAERFACGCAEMQALRSEILAGDPRQSPASHRPP